MRHFNKYHIIYTNEHGSLVMCYRYFASFGNAEKWLKKIKAKYWEIGIDDKR